MEVRLLGPLDVLEGGRTIACGGARQKAVLALLVLNANEVVPSEWLVVQLWGEDAPPSAGNALQAAVSRLRRILPRGRLVTRAPGYLMRTSPDELDFAVFQRLLADGHQALVDGDAAKASTTLRRALDLWRGPALADFRYEPFAQTEIARLEEQRLRCVEERVEADLALGLAAELVAELESLVVRHPARERLRGQLMLALYRSGRQSESLDTYRELRGILREELALDPAPFLRELMSAILRHDPVLTQARPARPATTGPTADEPVRKPVSVLCVELDLTSVPTAGSVDPEALSVVLSRATAVLTSALERHGGRLTSTAGSRMLGVFGVPALHEDDALRAAQAALAGRAAILAEAETLAAETGVPMGARFGLATGEALVGGPAPSGFTGVAVDRAVELAGGAGAGEILVGDTLRDLAAAALQVVPVGPGRFRLEGARSGVRPVPVRLDVPLVGRDEELDRLLAALARARRDRAVAIVTVLGDAGIGKSRLLHELAVRVEAEADVITGRCLPYGEGITFWPLRELVRAATGGDDSPSALAALVRGEADGAAVAERLAGALSPAGRGVTAAAEIFWATRRLLETLARRRPLVVVLEDLHWAEPTFLDLVESLVLADRAPLLVVCVARPDLLEHRPGWVSALTGAATLELAPLPSEAAGRLLDGIGAAPATAPIRARLIESAGGNPLFLEQLAASLADDVWSEAGPPLPPTIQALLAARLERLGPGETAVLARASVFGRDFRLEPLAELLPREGRPSLRRQVGTLMSKGLVDQTASDSAAGEQFRFRHILVQQAAYRAVPKSLRADLHERCAGWIERKGERAARYHEILGYHLETAAGLRNELGPDDARGRGLAERAAECLDEAGAAALARGDAGAAVSLLGRAASVQPGDSATRARVLIRLGTALMEAGALDRTGAVLADARRVASAVGVERLDALARVQELVLGLQVDTEPAEAAIGRELEGIIEVFTRAEDDFGLCHARRLEALVQWIHSDTAAAERAWQQAASHARRAGDEWQRIDIIGWLASSALWGSTPAQEGIRRCEGYLEEVDGHRAGEPVILTHLAGLYAMQGRLVEARAALTRGRAVFEDLGTTMTSVVAHPAALVAMLAGDPASAEADLRNDFANLEKIGEKAYLATTAAMLSRALAAQGNNDEAEHFSRLSLHAGATGDVSAQVIGRGVLARVLAAHGATAEAGRLAHEAVVLASQTDLLNLHGDALVDLAEVTISRGRPDEARLFLREAGDLYRRKGNLIRATAVEQRLEAHTAS